MIRAVLDTNLVISALLFGGIPRQVYDAGIDEKVKPITSEALVAELQRVLGYAQFSERLERGGYTAETLVARFLIKTEMIEPADVPMDAVCDADDRIVLACAVGGHADYIVSGDADLLSLNRYANIPIVTAAAFLETLSK